jgi:hypothetical protein
VGAPFFRLNPLFGIAKALDAESVLFDTSDYRKPVNKRTSCPVVPASRPKICCHNRQLMRLTTKFCAKISALNGTLNSTPVIGDSSIGSV